MPRATSVWTNTEIQDFEAGDFLRAAKLLEQVLQNIEHLGQSHTHNGTNGGGGFLATADPKAVIYYSAAAAS